MPDISNKARLMPESPIRKLVPYAEEAKKKGRKVYHLNIGQPDISTPEEALDAVKNTNIKVVEYTHSAGYESYRKKLAGYYQKLGINTDHTEMMITTGGSEALLFAFNTCLNHGDEVIIPEPFYANYNGFAITSGVQVKPVTSSIQYDFALPSIEEFEKMITEKTKGIVICNPNNPTGYLYSEEEMQNLKTLVQRHDLFLFSDEVYREFCYDGNTHISAMHLEGIENNVVLIDSVSKRYSMCGARIGALISKNKDIINNAMKFAQARLCPPAFGQIAGEAALDAPNEYFNEVYNEYIERRNFMVDALNKMEGVYSPLPRGAFYTVVQLPVDDTERFAQWMLSDFHHKNQTVMIAPASGFYSSPGQGEDEARIAYVLKIEDLKNAMETLEEALKAYPGKTVQQSLSAEKNRQ
ncbi:MAG: pyridoxal phosphate-dependent aminotransferase [Bacteroidota bacterium]